jgi:uncharacterized membrane protein YfcA
MIQRIQSIFYLLAGLSFASLFMLPFATSEEPVPNYMSDQVYNIQDHIIMMGMTIVGIFISLVAIFLYKNRGLQLRFGYLVIIFGILVPLVAFLLMFTEKTAFNSEIEINEKLGLFIPVLVILFGFLANRFVKKDDKLVRSMDRLR